MSLCVIANTDGASVCLVVLAGHGLQDVISLGFVHHQYQI